MRYDGSNVRVGMAVTSTTGERLGKVIRCDFETFEVEKGTFFPKDYELRYDHVSKLEGNDVTYFLSDAEARLRSTPEIGRAALAVEAARSRSSEAARPLSSVPASAAAAVRSKSAEQGKARISLMDEEMNIEKVSRETGHVRVHKVIRTEEKHITVPVTREEVVIERIAGARGGGLRGEPTFEEEILDIPLHEEDVRVTKRPVLREEVVVRTVLHAIDKDASASLRHEEAEVEDTRTSSRARMAEDESVRDPFGYHSPGSSRR